MVRAATTRPAVARGDGLLDRVAASEADAIDHPESRRLA
jgi:hypothetical protein